MKSGHWIRRTPLALALAVGACAPAPALLTDGPAQMADGWPVPQGPAEDHILTVRSDHYDRVAIDLVGEGVRHHLGTVERLQVRKFRLPARLTTPGTFVALDSYPEGRQTSYTTKLFSLDKGDAVDLKLEHSLTMSTFEIRRK